MQRLRELGWTEGRNLTIEYRWSEGQTERLDGLAAELVRLKVDVIVTHNTPPILAAKRATSVIPIVFASAGHPVGTGIVANLARPSGNVTGGGIGFGGGQCLSLADYVTVRGPGDGVPAAGGC